MTATLFAALALSIAAPAPKEVGKPAPKLEGEWVVEKFEGPKDAPMGNVTVTFTESRILIREPKRDRPEEADYTVDLTKKPAHIDIRPAQGKKDLVVYGILSFEGDALKLCFSGNGGARPTELKGDAEKGILLITLKRTKKAESK
jgi:uncharacterized protein (TIGR03067 family)